jgi:DNA-3-methyladenine glycosylase II
VKNVSNTTSLSPRRPTFASAARELAARDPVIARLVTAAGLPRLRVPRGTHFAALVRSIVYQQLAGPAASAIHARVVAALDGEVTPEAMQAAVRGIGPWTAEMFLLFQLRRLDVWPTGDLGVRRGYGLAWGVPMPSAKELEPLGDRFRPYRSVVAWYCWHASDLYTGMGATLLAPAEPDGPSKRARGRTRT